MQVTLQKLQPNEAVKNLVEDVRDFCIYGHRVLNEEDAKEYLKFLIDSVNLIKAKYSEKAVDTVIDKINTHRFKWNIEDTLRHVYDYFDGKTLEEFESEFNKMFTQLRSQKDSKGKSLVDKDWVKWIQGTFNNYLARLEPRSPDTTVDLGKKVWWKNKGKHPKIFIRD